MTNATRPQSLSRRTALAGLSAGALGLALARLHLVAAQEASPVPIPPDHPFVGTWQLVNYPREADTSVSFITLSPGGVYTESFTDDSRSLSLGVWQPTGDRTADIVSITLDLIPLDGLFAIGHFTVPRNPFQDGMVALWRINAAIHEPGDHATLVGSAEVQDVDGSIVTTFPYDGYADRMTLATSGAATPTA